MPRRIAQGLFLLYLGANIAALALWIISVYGIIDFEHGRWEIYSPYSGSISITHYHTDLTPPFHIDLEPLLAVLVLVFVGAVVSFVRRTGPSPTE